MKMREKARQFVKRERWGNDEGEGTSKAGNTHSELISTSWLRMSSPRAPKKGENISNMNNKDMRDIQL